MSECRNGKVWANDRPGLGLSVVHGIVERLDGTLSVRSQPDEGTTFELLLPETTDAYLRVVAAYALVRAGRDERPSIGRSNHAREPERGGGMVAHRSTPLMNHSLRIPRPARRLIPLQLARGAPDHVPQRLRRSRRVRRCVSRGDRADRQVLELLSVQ
jgi:hypothetical protein